jgi:hypothetical protein
MKPQSYRPKDRVAQISVARSLWIPNFVMLRLIFVGHQCETYCMPPLWHQNFEMFLIFGIFVHPCPMINYEECK